MDGDAGERLAARYGHPETILGRLTGPAGVPIVGAQVNVRRDAEYAGAQSGGDAGRAHRLERPLHVAPAVGQRLAHAELRVQRPVRLAAGCLQDADSQRPCGCGAAHRAADRDVGGSIHFSGRLLGGPIPKGGKLVVLEARSPGGPWLEFNVVRSDTHGRVHASYRFKFPGRRGISFVCCAKPRRTIRSRRVRHTW